MYYYDRYIALLHAHSVREAQKFQMELDSIFLAEAKAQRERDAFYRDHVHKPRAKRPRRKFKLRLNMNPRMALVMHTAAVTGCAVSAFVSPKVR